MSSISNLAVGEAVETPSGLFYPIENPQLEFNYLKTYDKSPEEKGSRAVDLFPQSTTTFVYAEIEFKNLLYKVRDYEYKLTFKYYLENGERLGEFSTTFLVEKGWEDTYYSDSWGWDEPGRWPLGTHRIEVWVGDTKFAVKQFTVINK